MASELGVGLEDAVGGRVVTSSVHGIRAGLVERCREPDIASGPPSDGDLRHLDCDGGCVCKGMEGMN